MIDSAASRLVRREKRTWVGERDRVKQEQDRILERTVTRATAPSSARVELIG